MIDFILWKWAITTAQHDDPSNQHHVWRGIIVPCVAQCGHVYYYATLLCHVWHNKLEKRGNTAKRKTWRWVDCKKPQINVSFTIAITLISCGKTAHVQKNQLSKKLHRHVKESCLPENVLGTLLVLSAQVCNWELKPLVYSFCFKFVQLSSG